MHRRLNIYHSRLQFAITIFVIILPIAFLLLFTRYTEVTLSQLSKDILVSSWRLFAAYVISVALGWLIAIATFRGKVASVALPIFDILQSFPTFAALPLATYFFGASNITVIIFLVLTIIWPILFSIISSLKLIRADWEEAVKISGVKGFKYFKLFLWPVSVPGVVTGSIIGLGEGWEALIATEIIVKIRPGLGSFFDHYQKQGLITALGILGFLLIIFSINKIIWLPMLDKTHDDVTE